MSEHTPTPWVAVQEDQGWNIETPDGHSVAHAGEYPYFCISDKADADFIVRAVNSHDELLKTLWGLYGAIQAIREDLGTNYPALAEASTLAGAAIAKAEGVTADLSNA